MENQVKVHPRAGWQEDETARLFTAVKEASRSGAPLRSVFESLSGDLGRKPNSIRNYYYACLRQKPDASFLRAAPFNTFTPEETHNLLRQVLMARGQGMSVRSCVMTMAGGDHSRMLRYQNKYRTLLKHRPELVEAVREELRREGLPYPAEPALDRADSAFCDPEGRALRFRHAGGTQGAFAQGRPGGGRPGQAAAAGPAAGGAGSPPHGMGKGL